MPKSLLNKLPNHARQIFESTYKEMRNKGYSESKSSKIAISAVKKSYKKVGDKWVRKEKKMEKSYSITEKIMEKDFTGDIMVGGYLLRYEEDDDEDIYTPEYAKDILPDLEIGSYFHEDESKGVLELVDKKVDDNGIYGVVKINKEHPYAPKVIELIKKNPDTLGFSIEAGAYLDSTKLIKSGDKYKPHHYAGKGYGFGITNNPINRYAKAKAL